MKAVSGRSSRFRAVVRTVLLLCTCLLAFRANATAEKPGEYEVKAAFLFNFARFVRWPDEEAAPGKPLRVCVLGRDPFGPLLEHTIGDKTVRNRPVVVERPESGREAQACEILFISSSEDISLGRILEDLGEADVLTVGESEGFVDRGGMIQLRIEEGRVRFDVNPETARRAHLRLSSQLLRVATVVGEGASNR